MTDLDEAPDAYDPNLECGAWRKAPSVIGGPTHSHVCREPAGHAGAHHCPCGTDFRPRTLT